MTQPLAANDFKIFKQTRTGLLSYPLEPNAARGHLATSVYLQMSLDPHIVHVVGHSEAHHAARPEEVIEACKTAYRAIENALGGQPDMTADTEVQRRKNELIGESEVTLRAIRSLGGADAEDPFTDASALARAVEAGVLDAPHLDSNPYAPGRIVSRIDERGACVAVDPVTDESLSEEARIAGLGVSID